MYPTFYSLILRLTIFCLGNLSLYAEPLIGTQQSDIGAVPGHRLSYIALIVNKNSKVDQDFHLCTGTLVSKNQVLTAASCIDKVPSVEHLEVIFGTTKPGSPRHQAFNVLSKLTYEDWCRKKRDCFFEKYTDDICLLQLATVDVGIRPALIRILNTYAHSPYPYSGTPVKLTGWGHTNQELRPNQARKGYAEILDRRTCEERVKRYVPSCLSDLVLPDKIVCAAANPPILAVEGDFGGPAVYGKDKAISAIIIQRCPIRHPYDIETGQVNLLLDLSHYRSFFMSTLSH